ncbi:MAG: hypothetical protein M3680_31620 [Myxococcota bacterium]|nr:hypothetical protein [Myxococcota bacterium]
MKKLLAVGGLALIALLLVMWQQLGPSSATPSSAASAAPVATVPVVATATPVEVAAPAPAAPAEPTKPEKLDPQSDEFFYKHDEVVVPNLMRSAVKCWENVDNKAAYNRNQSLVLKFKQKIVNGTVTIHDVQVEGSSIKDATLEACFIQQIRNTTWHDDALPDWEQDDEIKLGPRTLKKYTRANIEYVGPEAPKTPTYIRE